MTGTRYRNYFGVAVFVVLLAALVAAKPAEAALPDQAFPDGHGPIAFEKDGDIWVASKMHIGNLTPGTASTETDPSVSPDGTQVAFSSDRNGDFDVYVANVFTGEAERISESTVDDRNPGWSADGRWLTYAAQYFSTPTRLGILSAEVG